MAKKKSGKKLVAPEQPTGYAQVSANTDGKKKGNGSIGKC